MPLIHCPECNREISDKVKACPFCGYPFEPKVNAEKDIQREKFSEYFEKNIPFLNKKGFVYLAIGSFIILFIAALFLVIPNLQQKTRSDEFNAELKEILLTDYSEESETKINISGSYASQVTFIGKTDLSTVFYETKSDSEELFKNVEYVIYVEECLSMKKHRVNLILEYLKKEEFLKDKGFQQITYNPRCTIITINDKFEYYEDKYGNEVFTVNGEPFEYIDLN